MTDNYARTGPAISQTSFSGAWRIMVWLPHSRMFDDRIALSRASLEMAITEAVKASPDCEAFVGVFVMPVKQKSRFDANWSVRGVKFGTTDRDKSSKVLASTVEFMQREFSLSEGGGVAASATQFAQIPEDVEDAASGTDENRGASSSTGAADGGINR